MRQRISLVIAHLKQYALPSPANSEAAAGKATNPIKINPTELAAMARLSLSHFYAAFKAETQLSPMQFVKKLQLEHASTLLTTTPYRLKEIAEQSGYADVYHFSRDFKLAYQASPSEHRRQQREKENQNHR